MIERLIPFLIDALIVYFVVRFFMRMVSGRGGPVRRPTQGPRVPERPGGTLVRDPECGTYVLQAHAVRLKSGAETLFFCSPACRDAYQRRA
jgi:hypothetical protein